MSQAGALSSSGGGSGSNVQTLTGNTGGAVPPTSNNINVVGTGSISVAGTPGTSTLTISSSGGGGSGSLVLIQTQTATNQTTLNFTTGITNTYNTYFILSNAITDLTTAGTAPFVVRLSTNGGATYINTGYQIGSTGLNIVFLDAAPSQASFSGYLYGMTSGTGIVASVAISYRSAVGAAGNSGDSYSVVPTIVNALQFAADDGTAFSGTISLYGVVQ